MPSLSRSPSPSLRFCEARYSRSLVESRLPRLALSLLGVVVVLHFLFLWRNGSAQTTSSSSSSSSSRYGADGTGDLAADALAAQPFPRKIWQTAKSGIAGMDDGDREAVKTWTKMNQKWRYESITQYSAESYVRETFGAARPDIVEVFTDLQDPILRADLIRYLVLLGDGGLYTDLDTRSLKPIDDWVPHEFRAEANVVVGVEYDRLQGGRWSEWTLDLQFSTWAILAKPGHAVLELTVRKVMDALRGLALAQGTPIAGIRASYTEVLDTTGPAMFTNAVFESLALATGSAFTWENVTDLKAPVLIEDVLI